MLKKYATVSRWEFLPAVAVAILIGIFMGAPSFQALLGARALIGVIEGMVVFFLLFDLGFMVNCWADWEVDREHKTHLHLTVKEIGRDRLGYIVIAHIVAAIVLSVHLSLYLQRPGILLLVLVGIFIGVFYSVEPLRFKRRKALHSLMALPTFFMPGVYSYLLVNGLPLDELYSWMFLIMAVGVTMAHYGLVLVSQTEDYPEDKAHGLITPAVHWGLERTLVIAMNLNLYGSVLIIATYVYFFAWESILLVPLSLLILVGRFASMRDLHYLFEYSRRGVGQRRLQARIREKIVRYPDWHAYGLIVIMISSLVLLIVRSL